MTARQLEVIRGLVLAYLCYKRSGDYDDYITQDEALYRALQEFPGVHRDRIIVTVARIAIRA